MTKDVLDSLGGYRIEYRGEVELKVWTTHEYVHITLLQSPSNSFNDLFLDLDLVDLFSTCKPI